MPDASLVREALAACPLVVVSDCIAQTDPARFAHVKLPALGGGEMDGTITKSERMISCQRGFLPPLGDAEPDRRAIARGAREIGERDAFNYSRPHATLPAP